MPLSVYSDPLKFTWFLLSCSTAELHELHDMLRYSLSDFGRSAVGLRALRLLCSDRGELRQFLIAVELVLVLFRLLLKVVSLVIGFVLA